MRTILPAFSLSLLVTACASGGGGAAHAPLHGPAASPCPPGEQLVCQDKNATRLGKQKMTSDKWCACQRLSGRRSTIGTDD